MDRIVPNEKAIKEIINRNIYGALINLGNFISTQSILVKKSNIEKYFFDIKFPRLQDYDLMLRMIPNLKVSFTNEILVELFRNNDSISNDPIKLQKSLNLLLKKNYEFNSIQKKKFKKFIEKVRKINNYFKK